MFTQRANACLCSCTGRLVLRDGSRRRPPPLAVRLSIAALFNYRLAKRPQTLSNAATSLGEAASAGSSSKPYPNLNCGVRIARIASVDKPLASNLRFSALSVERAPTTPTADSEVPGDGGLTATAATADSMAMSESKDHDDAKKRVVIIAGPTAVGKTRLALALAKRLGGEIISADSVQVYRGLDVGSAKTPVNEREGIPHHLIDIADPTEDYTAGRFYDDARAATEKVLAKGAVPIVVGGTGMYLRWYMNGKVGAPKATKEVTAAVEEEVERLVSEGGGWDAAVTMLADAGDPTTAHSLARNDWYRLRRALEIIKASGQPRGAFPKVRNDEGVHLGGDATNWDYEFQCYFLYQPRPDLYRAIDLRCEQMLEEGMLEEASWLLDSGLQPNTNSASRAIGYQLAMEFLRECRTSGGATTEERFLMFLSAFQQASRNLVKRQLTWFRNEGQSERLFNWVDATQPLEVMVEALAGEYERPRGGPASALTGGGAATKEASYKEGKLLKVYQPTNRIFNCKEKCGRVLDWIRTTQRQQRRGGGGCAASDLNLGTLTL